MKARSSHSIPWYLVLIGGILCLGIALPVAHAVMQEAPQQLSDSPYLRIDPEKIVTSDRDSRIPCGECHTLEYDVWKATPHSTGFDELHRTEKAQEILKSMDFRLSKRESLCLRCHYTATLRGDQARAIAGVSCDSCHGAALDWVDIHNDYGGAAHDTESEAHRQQRIAQSEAGGMLRPSDNLYAVAANCFECHTIPNEKLVTVGGHATGGKFDLLARTDDIRHNFLQAQWSNDETNRAKTPERKRLMFVLGRVLTYEYGLRAAAEATEPSRYFKSIERQIKSARRDLDKLYRAAPLPEVQTILTRGRDVKVAPNNKAALLAAADAISTAAQQFAKDNDGSQLDALDALIDPPATPSADPDPGESTPDDPEPGEATPDPDDPETDPGETVVGDDTGGETDPTDAVGGETTQPTGPTVAVSGLQRRRPAWFAAAQRVTIGVDGCNCHDDQLDWLYGDKHSQSAEPLLNHDPKAVQIAQTYGLSVSQMKRGNQICMNCHGTIITGEEAEAVYDGVSCESCHGPGEDYKRKHQPPKPAPANWSAYEAAGSLGLINQENPNTRAGNCVRCHHITDERLISSGHPTGEGFSLGERSQQIRHWEAPILGAGALNSAYQQARGRRAIPQVAIATPVATTVPPPPVIRHQPSSGPAGAQPPPSPIIPKVRPAPRSPRGGAGPRLDLPPLPAVSDTTSTEEILLIVKQRLEQLYQALGRGQ